jgi:MFS family permease
MLHYMYTLTLFCMANIRGGRLILGLYALELGAGPVTVGLLAAMFSLMPALLAWQVGKWADRFGARGLLLFGSAGCSLGIAIPFFFQAIPALFIAAAVSGLAFAMLNVTQQNAVGMMSAPEDRTKNFANFTLMMSLGNFAGPLVAGFSIDHSGYAWACLYMAALGFIPAIMLMTGGRTLPKGSGEKARAGGGMMALLRDRTMLKILLVGSVVMAGVDMFAFYVPIYTHGLGLSASTIGIIMACFSAAAFISRGCLAWFLTRATVEQVLVRAFILAAAAFVCFPFFQNPVMLSVLSFVYGFGLCVGQPITMMLSFSNSADGRSGEVMGLRQSVNHGTRVVAPIVFGAIGSVTGLVSVFIVGAAMLASGGLAIRGGKLGK